MRPTYQIKREICDTLSLRWKDVHVRRDTRGTAYGTLRVKVRNLTDSQLILIGVMAETAHYKENDWCSYDYSDGEKYLRISITELNLYVPSPVVQSHNWTLEGF